MTGGVVNIGYVELVGASLLMLVAGIVSWRAMHMPSSTKHTSHHV